MPYSSPNSQRPHAVAGWLKSDQKKTFSHTCWRFKQRVRAGFEPFDALCHQLELGRIRLVRCDHSDAAYHRLEPTHVCHFPNIFLFFRLLFGIFVAHDEVQLFMHQSVARPRGGWLTKWRRVQIQGAAQEPEHRLVLDCSGVSACQETLFYPSLGSRTFISSENRSKLCS